MDGGGRQHALTAGTGALEDHMAHPVPLALVQQEILTPGGMDGKAGGSRHLMDGLGGYTSGVDHIPTAEITLVGVDQPAVLQPFQTGDGGVQPEVGAVAYGGLCQSQAVFPGGTDGGGRGPERGGHLGGKVGVHGPGLIAGEHFQAGHAVVLATLLESTEGGLLLRGEGQHEGAALPVGYVQLGTQFFCQGGTPYVEFGHKRARLGVISGMENGGVCLGGAVGYVIFPLQNSYVQTIAGELEGGRRAGNAAANNENVIHNKTSWHETSYAKSAPRKRAKACGA